MQNLLTLAALSVLSFNQGAVEPKFNKSPTQIVMLGSGTPIPDPNHQGPSLAIVVNGQSYIVDCGPGVVRQAAAVASRGVSAPGRQRLPVRYYRVALLFLVFDVEAVFVYPWAVTYRTLGTYALGEMFVFLGILLFGYWYARKRGGLEWQ